MEVREMYYTTIILLVVIPAVVFGIISWRKSKRGKEVIPYQLGKKTIYLKRDEIPHFESMARDEQRKMVNRFEARVKSGKIVPVYKHGKIIGYINKR